MYERILVPLDGSKAGESAIPYVLNLVTRLKPEPPVEVILLKVVTSLTHWVIAGETSAPVRYTDEEIEVIKSKAREYLEGIAELFYAKGVQVRIKVCIGDPAAEIDRIAINYTVDLIAMSSHGRSGLSRLAFGSVTTKVLRSGRAPVLTIRATE